jgi:hypothetical protein
VSRVCHVDQPSQLDFLMEAMINQRQINVKDTSVAAPFSGKALKISGRDEKATVGKGEW